MNIFVRAVLLVTAILMYCLAGVAAHAAPAKTLKKADTLTQWTITPVTTETEHYACEATRMYGDVKLTVRLPVPQPGTRNVLGITVEGVGFGLKAPSYGVWQVDKNTPQRIMGSPTSEWTTDMQISADQSDAESLKQFAAGGKLKLVFSNRYHVFALDESAAMLRALKRCNDTGQAMLDAKRIDASIKAPTRRV